MNLHFERQQRHQSPILILIVQLVLFLLGTRNGSISSHWPMKRKLIFGYSIYKYQKIVSLNKNINRLSLPYDVEFVLPDTEITIPLKYHYYQHKLLDE